MLIIGSHQKRLGLWSAFQRKKEVFSSSILHKFFNHVDILWVHLVWARYYNEGRLPRLTNHFRGLFWWRDLLKLLDSFKGMTMVNVQDGKSCFFWLDLWNHNVLQLVYPELCSFAKDTYCSR
jgi:hypothetical protein